ncbi:MAG: S-layer homology domain-containing protein [Monoglobales bacterium]
MINSHVASSIQGVLTSYYDGAGITLTDKAKVWFEDGTADKSAVSAILANYTYVSVSDFKNQFEAATFLDVASKKYNTEIISFLRSENGNYKNYGTATNLSGGGTTFTLDFTTFDSLATTPTRLEYAGAYMAGTYTTLDALQNRFNALLAALPSISEPTAPSDSSAGPSGGGSGTSVSVGLVNPIVGDKVLPFTDLAGVDWAVEAIRALYLEKVIDGVSENRFDPDANVTREQFVKIIVNAFNLVGTGKKASFDDVDQNEWYAPYINTAVELGIINGISADEFGVGQNISRQDMTVIMYRVAKFKGIAINAKSNKQPKDISSVDDYAVEAVNALYQAEIINGVSEGVFAGYQTATRAQAAKLSYDLRKIK